MAQLADKIVGRAAELGSLNDAPGEFERRRPCA
jgi:hypothetical protein